MTEIFNATQEPVISHWFGLLALLPLAWPLWKQRFSGWALAFSIAIGLLIGIPLWDQRRVLDIIATGQGLQITRGTISNQWHFESWRHDRDRIGVSTTISEGFDVGEQRFTWNIGRSYSALTFTNQHNPPVQFEKGMAVEVSWFSDASSNNEPRIVRLALGANSKTKQTNIASGVMTDLSNFS